MFYIIFIVFVFLLLQAYIIEMMLIQGLWNDIHFAYNTVDKIYMQYVII